MSTYGIAIMVKRSHGESPVLVYMSVTSNRKTSKHTLKEAHHPARRTTLLANAAECAVHCILSGANKRRV